jgi:hypothetical protein
MFMLEGSAADCSEYCGAAGAVTVDRIVLDCCRLATSQINRLSYDRSKAAHDTPTDRGNERLSLYSARDLPDDLRSRPPPRSTAGRCERCQQDLPVADEGDWLTYRRTHPRFERTG